MATLDSAIRIAPDVLGQEVQGESVLLHLGNESYFGLNPMGTLIWQHLQAGTALRRIHALIRQDYDVESAALERDLLNLVDELQHAGLILVSGDKQGG